MAISATCKKCGKEMDPGATCPICGGKLSLPHTLWRISRRPVLNWISWNSFLRLALPVLGLVALILLIAEMAGGTGGLRRFLEGPVPGVLLWLLAGLLAAVGLLLLLQGRETLELAADKSGVTLRVLLPRPTPLRLLAHGRSPRLMQEPSLRMEYGLLVDERRVDWKELTRVQLWPEKGMFLLYGPRWWLRMAVPCDAEGWREMSAQVTDKLARKKGVVVPPSLRPPEKPKAAAASSRGRRTRTPDPVQTAIDDALMADITAMNAELERQDKKTQNAE